MQYLRELYPPGLNFVWFINAIVGWGVVRRNWIYGFGLPLFTVLLRDGCNNLLCIYSFAVGIIGADNPNTSGSV